MSEAMRQPGGDYNFAFLDEGSKREIRRSILKAVAVPGYQVPFGSRELPIGRGWGTGGIQLTMSLIGPDDVLKVIDQGYDDSVNAVSIKRLITSTTGVTTTTDMQAATLIQTRHRVPEEALREDQILVLQVPEPEPLRVVDTHEAVTRQLHAEAEYTEIWVGLYEHLLRRGSPFLGADHPVLADNRYVMNPSPIPRYDNPKLHQADCLYLFGAGREKKIYAIPPILLFPPSPLTITPFKWRTCPGGAAACAGRRTCSLTRCSTRKQVRSSISARTAATA